MSVKQSSEYNILGCNIRISADEKDNTTAQAAVNLLRSEIMQLREERPRLRDIDLAVMSALRIASKYQEVELDFKESISSLKTDIADALNYVEQVSQETVTNRPTQ